MEEKKSNKGLVWLIVILIILVLGLIGYIVYDKVILNDKDLINENASTKTITTSTTKLQNKWEDISDIKCLNKNIDEECIIYEDTTINVSLKNLETIGAEYSYSIFLNNKLIKNINSNVEHFLHVCGYDFKKLDENNILIEYLYYESSDYDIYNNDGELVKDFDVGYLIYKDNEFKITYTKRYVDWAAVHHCDEIEETEIFETKSILPYLGNGELGEEKIISKKTLSDVLYDECKVRTCEEAKNSCFR